MSQNRLLVVDDEPEFCQIVKLVATELGYDLAEANNGDEFKRLYSEFEPTTIVLDLIMPQTDGIDLLRWLIDQECRAKIIVVTGYDTAYSKMAKMIGDEGGIHSIETFTKPIQLDDLRRSLQ